MIRTLLKDRNCLIANRVYILCVFIFKPKKYLFEQDNHTKTKRERISKIKFYYGNQVDDKIVWGLGGGSSIFFQVLSANIPSFSLNKTLFLLRLTGPLCDIYNIYDNYNG